jgi:hypothetical protein
MNHILMHIRQHVYCHHQDFAAFSYQGKSIDALTANLQSEIRLGDDPINVQTGWPEWEKTL